MENTKKPVNQPVTSSTANSSQNKIACIIMASGISKRFGSNKLLQDLNGQPLFTYILKATAPVFTDRVVVTKHAEIAAYCESHNIPVILHELPNRNDTIRLGLSHFGPDYAGFIFCPSDQPLLTSDTLCHMADYFACNPNCIVQPEYNGVKGAPVIFPSDTFNELLNLPAGVGGSFVAKKNPDRIHLVSVGNEYELCDIDTPDDLANLTNCTGLF